MSVLLMDPDGLVKYWANNIFIMEMKLASYLGLRHIFNKIFVE